MTGCWDTERVVPTQLAASAFTCETTLLAARPARATLRAASPSLVLTLDAAGARALAQEHPRLGALLFRRLAARFGEELDRGRSWDYAGL